MTTIYYNLRPSASGIWMKCAANPRIAQNAKRKPVDSDAAKEGTCAAWVAECVLKGTVKDCGEMVGQFHENGWMVDAEMAYHVQGYVDAVRARGGTISTEQSVRLNDAIGGTFDSSSVSYDETTLNVDDLKYGYKLVEVFENTQTIIYGCGELIRLNNPKIQRVRLGIYQPRAWHPEGIHRTWSMSVQELWALGTEIANAGMRAQDPEAFATPGPHCEYCKGILECHSNSAALYAGFQFMERKEQGTLSPEELSNELLFLARFESMFKARKTAIEAEAMVRIDSGEFIRGWNKKERHGHRKFTVDLTTVHMLTGIEPFEKVELTPAKLEQAGADKKIVKSITKAPVVGYKVEHVSEKDFGRMFRDQ